jgi:hypothetical protein
MRSRRLLGPSLAAVALLAGCGDDDTKTITDPEPVTKAQIIDVGRGIAGAAVGMPDTKVKQVLGPPDNETQVPGIFGGTNTKLDYPDGLTVTLSGQGRDVISVESTGPAKTRSGVGVGSTEQQVVDGVDGVTCEDAEGTRLCRAGTATAGAIVTDFRLRGGRVVRVLVGRVID